ncbi:amidase [Solirubrobacter ginsenosidimutans]|uniref:Amidase n=1 Tax=Solirubrobacter ginsenosidimutans TaxID=490573 RepID=A0A9X3RZL3_9ACTN|nr:amidase [Solirubrobacter ginsenosidimutans]MDA0161025.1 amidase [Solirubrobacter ginsenosidimutans]
MELIHRPAVELAALIASRAVSAGEVFAACAAQIAERSDLNALVAVADFVDPLDGPLCGVPFTVKDTLGVAGLPLVAGVPERVGVIASSDAVVVARLRVAGAVVVGKTNCPPWGGGDETVNEVFGRTSNPYDVARTPGGSSGGEAAAVAAGCSGFGIGTDSGGSIRVPAHFCGLASLKPTAGRVPVRGLIDDLGPVGELRDPRTQVGPLVRSVADLALILSVIQDRGEFAAVEFSELRIAMLPDDGVTTPDAATARVVAAAGDALRDVGAHVEEAAPPASGHAITTEIWASYGSGAISYDLLGRWDAYREAMLRFGERFDVLLSPVFATAAPRHGEMSAAMSYTTPHSLSGWPAATVRCGASPDGLPIGVQVAAHPWRDDVALAVAGALEDALGGYLVPS